MTQTSKPVPEEGSLLRRLPAGRKADLAAYVYEHGQVAVSELAEHFKVSTDTIRRDLDDLDSENVLIRTHGGAISPNIVPKPDTGIDVRMRVQISRKEAIGAAAASLIQNNSVVIMNAGTTILSVARHLSNHTGLTIATNNLQISKELQPKCYRALHIFGGTVLHTSQATIGPVSFQALGGGDVDIQCNLAVIAVGGVSADGYSVSSLAEASMLKEMMARAEKVAILADGTKTDVRLFAQLAELGRADYFITDSTPLAHLSDALKKHKVEVITPPTD
jgi:DeoR/GlpR family transcriptional regulator of sugar metabolism